MQLTDYILKRRSEHRDSIWPKDFLFSLGGFEKGISRYALKHAPPADGKKTERRYEKLKIRGVY
jgi:hypothetical protein